MLNYVAAQSSCSGCGRTSCARRAARSRSPRSSPTSCGVPVLILACPRSGSTAGFVLALVMAAIVSWFLFKTTKGYELRASGFNLHAARYAGMSASRLDHPRDDAVGRAGRPGRLDGGPGHRRRRCRTTSASGVGFTAIALALLAGNRPLGIVLAALLFGALSTGGKLMEIQTGIPLDLLVVHPGAGDHVRRGARASSAALYRFDATRVTRRADAVPAPKPEGTAA